MIKQLLSIAVMGGFALSATASIPCPIKHNNDWQKADDGFAADGNGMCYSPSGSATAEEATDPNFVLNCYAIPDEGKPGFNDGAPFSKYKYQDSNSGFQWQSASIKPTTPELQITKNHVVVAFDYKTNKVCNQMTVYFVYSGQFIDQLFQRMGCHMTPSDEWQTVYMYVPIRGEAYTVPNAGPINTGYGRHPYFGIDGDESKRGTKKIENKDVYADLNDYLWIRTEDLKRADNQDFFMQIKQPRWLTLEEADAEIAANLIYPDEQPIHIGTTSPNSDMYVETDDDGEWFYMTAGENPCLNLYNPCTPGGVSPQNTKFSIEYKVEFIQPEKPTDPRIEEAPVAILPMNYQNPFVGYELSGQSGVAMMKAQYEISGDEWGVIEYNFEDLADAMFMKYNINCSGLWMQFRPDQNFPEGTLMYFRNAKWSKPNSSGIENIGADNAEGPVTYYNLQGVQVANPTNGLYIKKQGNTTTKVLVK